jgi:hypothetical protein
MRANETSLVGDLDVGEASSATQLRTEPYSTFP